MTATVACSTEAAARGRTLQLVAKDPSLKAEARLVVQRGEQTLTLEAKADAGATVELSAGDQNPDDDRAEIAPESRGLSLAVHADATDETVATGGAPVLEQALHALPYGVPVRPFAELPREAAELNDVAALFIDNPAGLTPETRGAIDGWLESGAVAALFLGARAQDTQLGASLEPFVRGAVDWAAAERPAPTIDVASFNWLGAEAESLKELAPKGRARLDTALLPGAEIVGPLERRQGADQSPRARSRALVQRGFAGFGRRQRLAAAASVFGAARQHGRRSIAAPRTARQRSRHRVVVPGGRRAARFRSTPARSRFVRPMVSAWSPPKPPVATRSA